MAEFAASSGHEFRGQAYNHSFNGLAINVIPPTHCDTVVWRARLMPRGRMCAGSILESSIFSLVFPTHNAKHQSVQIPKLHASVDSCLKFKVNY